MNKKLLVLLLFAILVITTACKPAEESKVTDAVNEPKEVTENTEVVKEETEVVEKEVKRIVGPLKEMIAPDFTLADIDGNEVTLSELQGNVVLLTFWTSW